MLHISCCSITFLLAPGKALVMRSVALGFPKYFLKPPLHQHSFDPPFYSLVILCSESKPMKNPTASLWKHLWYLLDTFDLTWFTLFACCSLLWCWLIHFIPDHKYNILSPSAIEMQTMSFFAVVHLSRKFKCKRSFKVWRFNYLFKL